MSAAIATSDVSSGMTVGAFAASDRRALRRTVSRLLNEIAAKLTPVVYLHARMPRRLVDLRGALEANDLLVVCGGAKRTRASSRPVGGWPLGNLCYLDRHCEHANLVLKARSVRR